MSSDGRIVAFNRSEHMYWAGEGFLGPVNITFMLCFDRPLEAPVVRQALRELASACPRLRGVVEPGLWRYHLRILPDDQLVDQLFDDAYRVQRGVDPSSRDALQAVHNELMNEQISLERGLPWRARFLPHPSEPALLLTMAHLIGDGRSMIMMMSAILARLNGKPIEPMVLDNPSMNPAVWPRRWWQWPGSALRWWRDARADARAIKGLRVVRLNKGAASRCSTTAVRYHELPCPADTLRDHAKQHGTTVNTLLMVLLANAFLSLEPNDPQAAAAMRSSVDLRRYFPEGQAPGFGNYVHSFIVYAKREPTLVAQIKAIDAQVQMHLARYERRDLALPLAFYEYLPWIGRTLYSRLLQHGKRVQHFPLLSCHFSNLGNAEFINPSDADMRLRTLWPTALSSVFYMVVANLGGKQFMPFVYQNDEISAEDVERFVVALDAQFDHLLANQV